MIVTNKSYICKTVSSLITFNALTLLMRCVGKLAVTIWPQLEADYCRWHTLFPPSCPLTLPTTEHCIPA